MIPLLFPISDTHLVQLQVALVGNISEKVGYYLQTLTLMFFL